MIIMALKYMWCVLNDDCELLSCQAKTIEMEDYSVWNREYSWTWTQTLVLQAIFIAKNEETLDPTEFGGGCAYLWLFFGITVMSWSGLIFVYS